VPKSFRQRRYRRRQRLRDLRSEREARRARWLQFRRAKETPRLLVGVSDSGSAVTRVALRLSVGRSLRLERAQRLLRETEVLRVRFEVSRLSRMLESWLRV
jgi:hypothetical protein